MAKILLIDDEAGNFIASIEEVLDEHRVETATDARAGLERLGRENFDLVLLDIRMPPTLGKDRDREGIEALGRIVKQWPRMPVLMLSVFSEVDLVVEAIQMGAFHYIPKPPDAHKLRMLVEKALRHSRLEDDNRHLRDSIRLRDWAEPEGTAKTDDRLGALVGSSSAMQIVYQRIRKYASVDACVLIRGETGAGKELAAREIHRLSKRKEKPFIAVNCAAIPENLLESELFGHKKGSFTGATEDKKGLFVQADRGTLFLDEIGDLDMNLQTKLLRVLQDQVVTPIGGKSVQVDVRLLCATHRNLETMISEKAFREDLYYRVNVLSLRLPPLCERREDIPGLVRYFIETFAKETGLAAAELDPQALEVLMQNAWPGNVRELRNAVQRALVNASGSMVRAKDFELGASSGTARENPVESLWLEIEEGRRKIDDLTQFRNTHGEEALRYVIRMAVQKVRDYTAAAQLLGFMPPEGDEKKANAFRQWIKRLGLSKKEMLGQD